MVNLLILKAMQFAEDIAQCQCDYMALAWLFIAIIMNLNRIII